MRSSSILLRLHFFAISISALAGCHSGGTEEWAGGNAKQLSVSKKINGLQITVKFLPPSHLAEIESRKTGSRLNESQRDSLIKVYSKSFAFSMSIGPDEAVSSTGDVMTQGIVSQEQFNERINQLNFHMEEMLALRIGNTDSSPVMAIMESTGGLSVHRNFYIVFPRTKQQSIKDADPVEVIFQDAVFDTGRSYYPFSGKVISDSNPQ